jgi:hypothetical protein
MPITDNTEELQTLWTEFEVVGYTAGSIPDLDAAVTEVESKLKRGTLSTTTKPTLTDVRRWIARGKQELMQVKAYTFARRYVYTNIVSGDYRIGLPPDYNGGEIQVKDQQNDRALKMWDADKFDLKYPDVSEENNDEPRVFCIKNKELWFNPPSNGDIKLEVDYERSGDDNNPEDLSFLPEVERFRCCDYAVYESFESIHDLEKAGWYRQKWFDGLGRSVRSNARRRWSQLGYRAISIFEESGARDYQS